MNNQNSRLPKQDNELIEYGQSSYLLESASISEHALNEHLELLIKLANIKERAPIELTEYHQSSYLLESRTSKNMRRSNNLRLPTK